MLFRTEMKREKNFYLAFREFEKNVFWILRVAWVFSSYPRANNRADVITRSEIREAGSTLIVRSQED